jgi:hypothetical protein
MRKNDRLISELTRFTKRGILSGMSYTVLMVRFDGSNSTYRLVGSFPSPEAAFTAGCREIASKRTRPRALGFQIHDGNGRLAYEVRGGEANV